MVANTQCGYKVREGEPTRHDIDHLIFVRGCTDAMKVWAEDNLTTMAGVALGLAIPQVKITKEGQFLGHFETCVLYSA